jgi:hypothetical protein
MNLSTVDDSCNSSSSVDDYLQAPLIVSGVNFVDEKEGAAA